METATELPHGWWRWLLAATAIYAFILLTTRPADYVDSMNYAIHIVEQYQGTAPAAGNPMWDFGHAAWRPLGYAVWSTLHGTFVAAWPSDVVLSAGLALMLLSLAGGIASVILVFLLATRISGKAWIGALTACGYAATDAVVNYSATGTAYMMGASFQLAALYVLHRSIQTGKFTTARAIGAGALMGASVCIWFPNSLSVLGLFCFGVIWRETHAPVDYAARVRFLIKSAVGAAGILVLVYAPVMAAGGITSIDATRQWITKSRYGILPSIGYVRMVAGIVRSFFFLGQEGNTWKRILLGAHNARGVLEAFRSGIWKLIVVYSVLGLLVLRLWRTPRWRRLLICLAVGALPVLYFAAFLFDPAPPERYLPAFPLLFFAFACIMGFDTPAWFGRVMLPAFFVLMLVTNCNGMWRFTGHQQYENAAARLEALNPHLTPRDAILVVSFADDAYRFLSARPFDPLSRYRSLAYVVTGSGNLGLRTWQQHLAARVLGTWNGGGRVWMSLRLWARAPEPEWRWVEGDDPRIHWTDLPSFFGALDCGEPIGGKDGFAELLPSSKNVRIFQELLHE
ncbi:MAG TPA: hypothetical protein VML19_31420 [Verrucomicrobiae bacterium]|nr:hypothetical protein [Verrucomicrobiae bacterium]